MLTNGLSLPSCDRGERTAAFCDSSHRCFSFRGRPPTLSVRTRMWKAKACLFRSRIREHGPLACKPTRFWEPLGPTAKRGPAGRHVSIIPANGSDDEDDLADDSLGRSRLARRSLLVDEVFIQFGMANASRGKRIPSESDISDISDCAGRSVRRSAALVSTT
jgi:hypothetical protein